MLSDDTVTIQLNGKTIFTGGGFRQASSFTTSNAALFVVGTNNLTFTVNNVGGPTGLDFVADISGEGIAPMLSSEAKNHGQCVSAVAHETERGRGHGKAVSQAARFGCGNDN